MDQVLQPQVDLENVGPEVKSYIYQVLAEFEPFMTPETVIRVIAKDPYEASESESQNEESPTQSLYRLCIRLSENETHIEAEGVAADVYTALQLAKNSLMKTLSEIHDRIVDNSERRMQIQSALTSVH